MLLKSRLKIALAALTAIGFIFSVAVRTTLQQASGRSSNFSMDVRQLESSTTDDHGAAESGHESLFGALDNIQPNRFILSLLIVISAVLCVEYIFHLLHLFTVDSPFHKVVEALEKELMIVGCTAFIFKISINVTHFLSEKWFFALEFSDLLVPFFSFTNCIISLLLILASLIQCDTWSRAFHLRIEEILDYAMDDKGVSVLSKWWAPFSTVVGEMEFRIFHDIFCDNYGIRREAFAFDEYVQLVYEKYVLNITQLRFGSWVLFVVLLLFVLASRAMELTLSSCEHEDLHCYHLRETKIFVIFGAALCFLTIICAAFCRYYEIQFISRHGIAGLQDYPQFLMNVESRATVESDKKKFNEEDLKRVIQDMKAANGHEYATHHHYQAKQFQGFIRRMGLYVRSIFNTRVSPQINSINSYDEEYNHMMKTKFKHASPQPQSDSILHLDRESSIGVKEEDSLKHKAEHLDELFLLSQPELFFGCVRSMILPIALFFAMWIVNFSSIHISSAWKVLAITPGLLSLVLFVYMVRTAALLKAVYIVDKDAMLEVIEQTEGSRQLGETIREKLLQRITFMGEPYIELKKLFGDIDKDGSSKLSRLEFEGLMDRLDINFSRKKWKQIYHEIDRNYDDQVSFDEFILFLFPHNDVSTAMELKRLKVIKSRLEKKAKLAKAKRETPYAINEEANS